MSNTPFISICIPAYQRPALLKRLLDSIAGQSFNDYEVIITDDSPGADVAELIRSYPQLPVHYSRNDAPAGTPGNWNRAMQKATAPWIQVLHADDWYATPGSLAALAAVCRNSQYAFVFSASKEIRGDGQVMKTLQPPSEKLLQLQADPFYLVYDNMIGHPSVVLHKKDDRLQYDPAYKWVVDIDFYIRFLGQHPGFEYIREPLINIGIDGEQVSAHAYKNPAVEIPEYLQLISKLPDKVRQSNRYVFQALWTLVKKFRIPDPAFIRAQGYPGEPPEVTGFIIRYQQRIPRFVLKQTNWSASLARKCYHKWLTTIQPLNGSSLNS